MPAGAARGLVLQACAVPPAEPDDAVALEALSVDQHLALEKLMARLVSLASLPKIPAKT